MINGHTESTSATLGRWNRVVAVLGVPPNNAFSLYGLEADLGLHGDQFQILVSVLFVTYILSELPSNLVVKQFGPSRWISFIALSWGLVATFSGFVQNFAGMLVCRLLLGLFEGGLFPGEHSKSSVLSHIRNPCTYLVRSN
jgi:MFS family permease